LVVIARWGRKNISKETKELVEGAEVGQAIGVGGRQVRDQKSAVRHQKDDKRKPRLRFALAAN
jgi:hypothetical protein